MKNKAYILLFSLSFLAFFSKCKNPGIDYDTFAFTEENIKPEIRNVTASGAYDFLGEVVGIKFNIGLDNQLTDAESHPMDVENHNFSATVEGLDPGTLYHYCFEVDFGGNKKKLTDIKSFNTLSDKAKVRTLEITKTDDNTLRVKCIVDDNGGSRITERGICWNRTGNPNINNNHVIHGENGLGEYYCQIPGIEQGTTYFVRAYATNANGISYADEILRFDTESEEKPTVVTIPMDANGFTQTSAYCRGRITDEGSSHVVERGICFGATSTPDINGERYPSNSSENDFSVSLTNLSPNTTYYFCAYATNNVGTSYGSILDFTTLSINKFHIGTEALPNDGGQTEGSGDYEEGATCTVKASPNADYHFVNWTENNAVVSQLAEYSFTVERNRTLTANFELKSYTIVATASPNEGGYINGEGTYQHGSQCTLSAHANEGYEFESWTESDGTVISSDASISFVVTNDRTLVAHFKQLPQVPQGGIDGLFAVTPSKKVYFSHGNLQYRPQTGTWQFAPSQWQHIGEGNANISPTYSGWIDLFGWGTGDNPTNTSTSTSDYGNFHDWGDNIISNASGSWRTLNRDEWKYVFDTRPASTINGIRNARYAMATVCGVFGVILFPDEYTHPGSVALPNSINIANAGFNSNTYSSSQWLQMQANGCVFLPTTGYRQGTVFREPNMAYYWSSTAISYSVLRFGSDGSGAMQSLNPQFGYSVIRGVGVRLVHDSRQ